MEIDIFWRRTSTDFALFDFRMTLVAVSSTGYIEEAEAEC